MWLTKKSPVDVNEEVLREYIQDLSKTIQTDQETYNYDKTGLTDNPGSKKSLIERGCKYRSKKHFQTCISGMMSGKEAGEFHPHFEVNKAI